MKKTLMSDLVIARINKAVEAGVKIKAISNAAKGVSYFRVSSVVNTTSYRSSATFTDSEARELNGVLDDIKNAL